MSEMLLSCLRGEGIPEMLLDNFAGMNLCVK